MNDSFRNRKTDELVLLKREHEKLKIAYDQLVAEIKTLRMMLELKSESVTQMDSRKFN